VAAAEMIPQQKVVRVAVLNNPPYAYLGPNGFKGPSVKAFNRIAADNNWRVVFALQQTQDDVIGALVSHQADIGIGHLHITAERAMIVDVSDPDEIDSLALLTKEEGGSLRLLHIGSAILSKNMLALFVLGLVLILICGSLIRIIESRYNAEFPPEFRHNAWWAAQTMVAHNCGNKLPRSERGRYIAILLMLGGTIFTAQITAVLTTSMAASLAEDAPITGIGDIGGRRVATVYDSYGQQWLQQNLLKMKVYKVAQDCVAALEREEVSAVVYDETGLRRILAKSGSKDLKIVGPTFGTHAHGIMLSKHSQYLAAINRGIAKLVDSGEMQKLYEPH
jgi:ABC-type amino acid transport substrate-binding protein